MLQRTVVMADIEPLYEKFARQAVATFNEKGSASQQTFMLTLGLRPGQVTAFGALDAKTQQVLYQDGAGKDMLAAFFRGALTHGSPLRATLHEKGLPLADIIIQISEAWQKSARDEEEFRRAKEQYGPAYEFHPDRTETIMVALHTLHKSYIGFSPILENPRRAEYGPLENFAVLKGRFPMGKENDDGDR
jgi:hypothetical protein